MKYREVHFEDKHQDFLFWVIDEDGVVVDSQPFQYDIWKGIKMVGDVEVGKRPVCRRGGDDPMCLNYAITEIKEPDKVWSFWSRGAESEELRKVHLTVN